MIDECKCYYPDFSLYFFLMSFSVHSSYAPLKIYVTSCHANGSGNQGRLCWIRSLNLVTHCHSWIALWWDFRVQLHQLPLLTPNLVQLFLVIYWSTTEGGGQQEYRDRADLEVRICAITSASSFPPSCNVILLLIPHFFFDLISIYARETTLIFLGREDGGNVEILLIY